MNNQSDHPLNSRFRTNDYTSMIRQQQPPRTKSQLFQYYDRKQLQKAQSRITQNVQLRSAKKGLQQSTFLIQVLKNHFIFYNLSETQLQNIKQKMFICNVKQQQIIYEQGSKGQCFFIVHHGALQVLQDGKIKKTLRQADGFGEIALLYITERSNTVRAIQDSTLFVIDRTTFREAVEDVILKQYNENRKCLQGVRFFSQLTYQQKDLIASTILQQKFYKGQNIIQQGDPGSSLYFIKEGTASVLKGDKFIRKLGRGDSFGEQSLYYNTMRQYTIKADDQVVCLVLARDTLNKILGDKIYDVTFKNFIKWAFDKNPILSRLSKRNSQNIIEEMKISSFKVHQSIFRKGIVGFQKLVVVIEGSLKKMKSGTVVATKGQCFGEQFLLSENKNKMMDDQIVMSSYGVIAEVPNTAFFQAIDSFSIEEAIQRDQSKKIKLLVNQKNIVQQIVSKVQYSDFFFIQKIADGQFGQILLIKDSKQNLYTLKTYEKRLLQQYDVEKFIAEEKKVLQQISFPFTIKMGKVFHTNKILGFINQYINGQCFYEVLKQLGLLSSDDCQFYTANIVILLQYLQQKSIICRDIKPQNFMVNEKGYLQLINFSTAKISRTQANHIAKTYTIIGTPHYMAPDIILGKGYSNLVDLWSLGVCMYELVCGVLPFGDSADGAYQIYEQIMQSEIRFPQFVTDKKAKKLIQQLLSHNPQHRHSGSFLNLKSNPFFEDMKWNLLVDQTLEKTSIPYIPKGYNKQIDGNAYRSNNRLFDKLRDIEIRVPNPQGVDKWENFGPKINL